MHADPHSRSPYAAARAASRHGLLKRVAKIWADDLTKRITRCILKQWLLLQHQLILGFLMKDVRLQLGRQQRIYSGVTPELSLVGLHATDPDALERRSSLRLAINDLARNNQTGITLCVFLVHTLAGTVEISGAVGRKSITGTVSPRMLQSQHVGPERQKGQQQPTHQTNLTSRLLLADLTLIKTAIKQH